MLRWFRERALDLLDRGRLRRGEVGRRDVGRAGESLACRFLERQGLRVLARNVRAGRGEIDIIARDGPRLVFVEVKSRSGCRTKEETGLEKMDERKRSALRRSCLRYSRRVSQADDSRIDLVTVAFDRGRRVDIRWYPGFVEL